MKKRIWFLSLALFLGACTTTTEEGTIDTTSNTETVDTSASVAEEMYAVSVDIVVDGEEVPELSKELEVESGLTLMEVMKNHYEIEEDGGFLQAIEGYEQSEEENLWWVYQLNGEDGMVGASEYEVEDGDSIIWALTEF